RACLGACLLALGVAGAGAAQSTTASVRGYVRGTGGEVVGGATVTANNTENNLQRSATSNASGFYLIPGLPPGNYVLTSRMVGQGEQRRTIQLLIGQTVDVNFSLTA